MFVENPNCADEIAIIFGSTKGVLCLDNVVDSCDVLPEPSMVLGPILGLVCMAGLRRRK